MRSIRIGVIGLGFFGAKHAAIYKQLPHAHLTAVADIEENTAEYWGRRLECDWYSDYSQLLARRDIDAVDIVLPDDLHREAVLAALARGKHVLLEKPMAVRLDDCEAICRASRESQKKVMIGHILRFDPRSIAAKERIDQGQLGEIVHVTSRRNSPISGARHYAEHCALTTHSGVHDLDLVRWLVGSEYQSVYAKGRWLKLKAEGLPVYDTVLSLLTLANGVIYQMENCWVLPEHYPSMLEAKLQIVGTKGVLVIDVSSSGLEIYSDEGASYPDMLHWPEVQGSVQGHLREELSQFVDCIIEDLPVPVSAEDGYAASAAALQIHRSLEEDRVVQFDSHQRP